MYEVKREGGRVVIYNWDGKAVYNVSDASQVLYRTSAGTIATETVKDMQDNRLLEALATAVKLPL